MMLLKKYKLDFTLKQVYYHDSITHEIWEKTALQSRKCYMGEMNPSSEIQEWHPLIFPLLT